MGISCRLAPISTTQVEALRQDPHRTLDLIRSEDGDGPPGCVDIDDAWHGLHYLLTGTPFGGAPPLSLALLGGTDIGPDAGAGPARLVPAGQVAAIAGALAQVTLGELQGRYDPQAMDSGDVAPGGWVETGAQGLASLMPCFDEVARLYAGAARRGDAVLIWLS